MTRCSPRGPRRPAEWALCWPRSSNASPGSDDVTPEEWVTHDPDPSTAAELAACSPDELAARFARPLAFGTAGLRGPVRGGPDAMNVAVVSRATWAVARVLADRGLAGSLVGVGRDARPRSAIFFSRPARVRCAGRF